VAGKKLTKEEEAAAEKERMKKQLMLLGGLMVLVMIVNRKSIMKMMGMGSKGRRRGSRGRKVRPRSRAVAPAAASRSGGSTARASAAALTPAMIPIIDEATRQKLHQIGKPNEIVPVDEIRYDTRNPFIELALDDREIIKKQEERFRKPSLGLGGGAGGGGPGGGQPAAAAGGMYFRGVIPMGGSRYAVLQPAGMPRPRPVKEGSKIKGTDWVLLSIGPRDAFVVLHNPKAKRTREKISVVNRDGIKPEDLFLAKEMLLASAGVDIPEKKKGRQETDQIAPVMLAILEKRNGVPGGGASPMDDVGSGNGASEEEGDVGGDSLGDGVDSGVDVEVDAEVDDGGDGFEFFDE
jgi:hypothetical protein